MSDAAIVFAIIVATLGLFIWNRIPAVIVGVGVSLALFATGIITPQQALSGLGDPTVILIAGLFVIAAGLDAAGVTTWAGQKLVEAAGGAVSKAFLLLMLVIGVFCAMIGFNATVAALLPVTMVLAIRLKLPSSQLMMPLAFATPTRREDIEGLRAAVEALDGLEGPVTHLRRRGLKADAPPETGAETAAEPRRRAAGGSRRSRPRPAVTETPS
jgi:hypothetical protein